MKQTQRRIGFIKMFTALPLVIISALPFFSFSVYLLTSQWMTYILPAYILLMLYFIVYSYKMVQLDNSAIYTLALIFVGVLINVILNNSLSKQLYLMIILFAVLIQFVNGIQLLTKNRKQFEF